MGPPKPAVPLSGHCSVIYNDTLYVYSPDAFQSIPLSGDAQWSNLTNGVSATGAACVKGATNGDESQAALFVVGGEADSNSDYSGLQKYTFSSKKWETVMPTNNVVTQGRQNHGVTYLNSSSAILVYAGSTEANNTGKSSSTFLINTFPPYDVRSFESNDAPPAYQPLLMQWNQTHGVFVGGDSTNKEVWTFGETYGWQNLGVELPEAISDQDTVQTTIVSGDDGSKVLEEYDCGVSPNEVTRLALLNANGTVASTGTAVGAKKRKRDLTIDNWPSYNDTDAPTTKRSGFALAQDDSGRTVITGGADDDDPLAVFNERQNSWLDATSVFGSQQPLSSSTSVSPSAISSAAAAASSSSAAEANAASTQKSKMLTVLGATLGAIFGIAAILIILLMLLRWKREKRKQAAGGGEAEKDRMSFADRGMDGDDDYAAPKYPVAKNGSNSSLAIMSGKVGAGHKRGQPSDASTAGLVKKGHPTYNESLEMSRIGDVKSPSTYTTEKYVPRNQPTPPAPVADPGTNRDTERSSGWSRYFNDESTQFNPDRSTFISDYSRNSLASQSEYTNSRIISQPPVTLSQPYSHPSQAVPPLDLSFTKFGNSRVSRVATGSPTIGNSREDLANSNMGVGTPMTAQLSRSDTRSTRASSFDALDPTWGGGYETTSWTPMGGSSWNERVPSSLYTDSRPASQLPAAPAEAASSYYPDGTSSYYGKSQVNSLYPQSLHPNAAAEPGRESTMTVFPKGVPSLQPQPAADERQRQIGNQDMSWLNLGAGGS
ncbi:hypothetical protein K490DRAFT_64321 [Saccharata proteae CBS 121410]|uniref:Galactose oxidase n=1 Tax=Saccharata proteae CBS 121410 TaxID=1314787 RepID=A0A6A5YB74_9PEZI|nr:hypothetical protein K490DRAFT_64321 [Saccharata proteae CBS 121410]